MRYRYRLAIIILVLATAVAISFNRGEYFPASSEPGLTISPASEKSPEPSGSERIAGGFRFGYSGPAGRLCHSVESWENGRQQLASLVTAKLSRTDFDGVGDIVLEDIHGDVKAMANFLPSVENALKAVERGDMSWNEVELPAKFKAPKFQAILKLRFGTATVNNRSTLGIPFLSDSQPSGRIVHSPRKKIRVISSAEAGRFDQQPIVWGCFFHTGEDREWESTFKKQNWSDKDFELAAANSESAVLLRMWVLTD